MCSNNAAYKVKNDEEVPTVPMNPVGSPCDNDVDDHPYDEIDTARWRAANLYNNDETLQQQIGNQDTSYSMLGPEVDSEGSAVEPQPDMHYEMVRQFNHLQVCNDVMNKR